MLSYAGGQKPRRSKPGLPNQEVKTKRVVGGVADTAAEPGMRLKPLRSTPESENQEYLNLDVKTMCAVVGVVREANTREVKNRKSKPKGRSQQAKALEVKTKRVSAVCYELSV